MNVRELSRLSMTKWQNLPESMANLTGSMARNSGVESHGAVFSLQ